MRMYGKNEPTNQKMRAFSMFRSGSNYQQVASTLQIQLATAKVYTIDAFASGAPLDHERMAQLMGEDSHQFQRIKAVIEANVDGKLRTIKADLVDSTYNQIRFALACMIRNLHL